MKTNNKLSVLAISLISALSFSSFAQTQPVQEPANVPQVNKGNAFEREVTPLLREFARKKSQLELRKIDRELEKIDEESLKAQLDAESKTSQSSSANGAYDPFAGASKVSMQMSQPIGITAEPVSDVKVLMIYGFDSKLFAKITAGQQGGYVVKSGDVMPDGRIVSNITSNYIEVKKSNSKAKSGVERIFVSSGVQQSDSNSNQPTPPVGGSGGSAQVNKISTATPQAQANETAAGSLVAPIKSPGMIQ